MGQWKQLGLFCNREGKLGIVETPRPLKREGKLGIVETLRPLKRRPKGLVRVPDDELNDSLDDLF